MATFNASTSQYIDLNAAGPTSTMWGGASLPGLIGGLGAGSLAAGTAGWTFETTFRAGPESGNAKIFSVGAGQPIDNIFMGNDASTGAVNLNFGIYDANTNTGVSYSAGHAGILAFASPYVQYQWSVQQARNTPKQHSADATIPHHRRGGAVGGRCQHVNQPNLHQTLPSCPSCPSRIDCALLTVRVAPLCLCICRMCLLAFRYHVVFVLQQVGVSLTDSGVGATQGNVTHGAWFMYVNGALVSFPGGVSQNNIMPAQVPRPISYLAKSSWSDPAWSGLIDTFRIYNYALTASQVTTLYGGEMGGCAVPISTATPAAVFPNLTPRTTTGAVTPVYSLNFASNPGSAAGGYGWVQSLSTDSAANQALHQGVLTLNPVLTQYVNMSAASGANSVGSVMPTIGGGTAGWTFEVEFQAYSGADTWPKVFDIGTTRVAGAANNDIVLGWDGNSGNPDEFWQFDVVDSSAHEFQTSDALGEVPYNTWVHAVAVISAPTTNGNANYFLYFNGQLYTTINNVYYPTAVQRQNAFLGKSGWSDPYFNGSIDFFNIYSQALSDTQVAALYQATLSPSAGAGSSSGGAAAATSSSTGAAAGAASSSAGAAGASAGSSSTGSSSTPISGGGSSSLAPIASVCTTAPTCAASPVAVPPAWLNLTFSSLPSTATTPNYGWEAVEAGDAACTFQHRGVATFNASTSQYIDLNAAGPTSTMWGGASLPGLIGGLGAGSLAAGTAGWTFETTFRAGPESGNAKIFSVGAGQPIDNIFMGNDASTGAVNLNFGIYDANTNTGVSYSAGHAGILAYASPYVQYQWYGKQTTSTHEHNKTSWRW